MNPKEIFFISDFNKNEGSFAYRIFYLPANLRFSFFYIIFVTRKPMLQKPVLSAQ